MRDGSVCSGDEVHCCFLLDDIIGMDGNTDDMEMDEQGGGYASDRNNEVDYFVESGR